MKNEMKDQTYHPLEYKFSDKKEEIISNLKEKSKSYIKYELFNLSIVVLISMGIFFLIQKSPNQENQFDQIINTEIQKLKELNLSEENIENKIELIGKINEGYSSAKFYNIISDTSYKIIIMLIGFFLVRIFINFQIYNTKRASYTRSVAIALELYDGKGDFTKLVDTIVPEKYQSIAELPDSKIKDIISLKSLKS